MQSLRALKEVLGSTSRPEVSALESQHRYLLDAGGADVDFAGPAENQSTSVVCSSATQPALAGSVDGCSTEDSEIANAITEAVMSKNSISLKRGDFYRYCGGA